MRLIISPTTELDLPADELVVNGITLNSSAGAHADEVAQTFGVRGASFTYKADGVELSRTGLIPATANVLELIEATLELPLDPPPPPPPAPPAPLGDDDED
jgi:hypothetical protein